MTSSTETEEYTFPSMLQTIRGLPIPELFKKDIIEEVFEFTPDDGDIIIASYPKTGTVWMQYIVLQILSKGEHFPVSFELSKKVVPALEAVGVSEVKAMTTKPRLYQTHLPYYIMKKNLKSKVIYVYRKPDDTFVSFHRMMQNVNFPQNLDKLFDDFLNGKFPNGRYFEHILSYFRHEEDGNVIFISYEKLITNRKGEILRLAKFLGEEYYSALDKDESILDKILLQTSFKHMQKSITVVSPDELLEFKQVDPAEVSPNITFFRKGIIGDGKSTLTKSQLDRLKKVATDVLKGTNVLSEWFND